MFQVIDVLANKHLSTFNSTTYVLENVSERVRQSRRGQINND